MDNYLRVCMHVYYERMPLQAFNVIMQVLIEPNYLLEYTYKHS